MRSFRSTDLKQTLGDVLDAANQGPIAITKHKKPRYVLMNIHDYEQRFQKDERQAIDASAMPAEHLAMLEASRAGIEGEAKE